MRLQKLFEARRITETGVHFPKSDNLKKLDASKHTSGYRGEERHRKLNFPEYFVSDRIYFYIEGTNYRKEAGLGPYKYIAELDDLYDFQRDDDRLLLKAEEEAKRIVHDQMNKSKYNIQVPVTNDLVMTLYEGYIKEAGYKGYINYDMKAIVYYYDTEVERVG